MPFFDFTHTPITRNVNLRAVYSVRQIHINIVQPDNGVITVTHNEVQHDSSFDVDYNSQITISCTPNIGYSISKYTVNGEPYTENTPITVTDDISIEVELTPIPLTFTIKQVPNQTIKVTYNDTVYTETFTIPYNGEFSVTIEPAYGYRAGELQINNDTGIATEAINCTATEAIRQRYITIEPNEFATVTIHVGDQTYTESCWVDDMSIISFDVQPKDSSVSITGITINDEPYTNMEPYFVDKDISITVTTEIVAIPVTIVKPENGTITVRHNEEEHTDSFTVNKGDNITITCTADEGSVVNSVSVNDEPIENGSVYEVNSAITITAVCERKKYKIVIQQPEGAHITVNGSDEPVQEYYHGDEITILVTTDDGHEYTHTEIIEAGDTYHITVTQPENGQITINGEVGTDFDLPFGTEYTVEAKATTEGYSDPKQIKLEQKFNE